MLLAKGQNTTLPATTPLRAVVGWQPGAGVPEVDGCALVLGASGKVGGDADMVFYNQPAHPSGAVRYEGKAAGGETFAIDPARLPPAVDRVVIGGSTDGGTFGSVPQLYLAILDAASGAEILRFHVDDASSETAFLFAEVYRRGAEWKLRAVGQGYASGLAGFAQDFGVTVVEVLPAPPAAPAPMPPAWSAAPPTPPASPASTSTPIDLRKDERLTDMEMRVAATSPHLLSLTKQAAVSLAKRGLATHTARVALCLDISFSMYWHYQRGQVQALAERVLALGMRFDDDERIDVFLFGGKAHDKGPLALANAHEYIARAVNQNKLEGATQYGAAMKLVRRRYFGSDAPRCAPIAGVTPVYVMFVTDGTPTDPDVAVEQLRSSSYEPIFWQFMAVDELQRDGEFAFLERLDDLAGRYLDNAGFFSVPSPTAIADEDLFELMMAQYPGWLHRARHAGLLPPA
ncbi:VWA domain-containing protein [Dactylosporangium sp. NPDC049742]|uniref:VWA domain-containing protein n=1 Tax=Dactylosporangium sp. NPDC049742 TaxID=3154737 RepID=UPI003440F3F6